MCSVESRKAQPRWPVSIAFLAIGFLYYALPPEFSPGPDWLLLAVITFLLVPTILARRMNRHNINTILGYCILGLVTAALITSLGILISRLFGHKDGPQVDRKSV